MATHDVWLYRDRTKLGYDSADGGDITGYGVEALDGSIGKIDKANNEADQGHVVVDTGPWILGKTVMLPAGVVERVDSDQEKVYVNRTKDQIKNAPEYDDASGSDHGYRSELGDYYGPGGPAYRDWDDTPDSGRFVAASPRQQPCADWRGPIDA